jgi:hypothetical protein
MQSSLGALHRAELQAEFASQLVLGGCAAAALIMHKWVAGWHTPDLQSELILHLAPTLPATCASAVLLPLAPAPIAQIAAPMTKTRNCRVAMPVDPMRVSTARDSADRFCISIHQRSKARTCYYKSPAHHCVIYITQDAICPTWQHWWQIDVTYLTILLSERLGLVRNVTRRRNAAVPFADCGRRAFYKGGRSLEQLVCAQQDRGRASIAFAVLRRLQSYRLR